MRTRFQAVIVALSFIGAPILMLITDTLNLLTPGQYQWFASVTFWFSFCAYVAVIMGMVKLSGDTNLASVAAILAIMGTLIGITIIGTSRVGMSMLMQGIEKEMIMAAMYEPIVFFTSRAPGILFPVGLILLTITMKKAGSINTVNSAILLVGIILFPVGRIPQMVGFNVAGDILMLIVLAQIGLNIIKRRVELDTGSAS